MTDETNYPLGEVDDGFSIIETSENLLIQHIRTAGIRKPREIELINEIMALRRERRKSFNAIEQTAKNFKKENTTLQMQLTRTTKEAETEISLFKSSLSSTLKKKDLEVQSIIDHYDNQFLKEKERNKYIVKSTEEKLSKIYEEKLRQVEQKIEDLAGAKAKHDHTTAEAIAFDLTAKSISELNEQHQAKLMKYVRKIYHIFRLLYIGSEVQHVRSSTFVYDYRYKDALRSVAVRERDMADEVLKMTERLKNMEQERRLVCICDMIWHAMV